MALQEGAGNVSSINDRRRGTFQSRYGSQPTARSRRTTGPSSGIGSGRGGPTSFDYMQAITQRREAERRATQDRQREIYMQSQAQNIGYPGDYPALRQDVNEMQEGGYTNEFIRQEGGYVPVGDLPIDQDVYSAYVNTQQQAGEPALTQDQVTGGDQTAVDMWATMESQDSAFIEEPEIDFVANPAISTEYPSQQEPMEESFSPEVANLVPGTGIPWYAFFQEARRRAYQEDLVNPEQLPEIPEDYWYDYPYSGGGWWGGGGGGGGYDSADQFWLNAARWNI